MAFSTSICPECGKEAVDLKWHQQQLHPRPISGKRRKEWQRLTRSSEIRHPVPSRTPEPTGTQPYWPERMPWMFYVTDVALRRHIATIRTILTEDMRDDMREHHQQFLKVLEWKLKKRLAP